MRLRDYLHINVWLLPILLVVIPVILILFGSSFMTTPNTYHMTTLEDGWSVKHGNFHADDASLEDLNIGDSQKGDVVIISTSFPSGQVPSACIMFRTILSVVTVYIDDEEIYNYGKEFYDAGRLLPKHFNIVPIKNPQQYAGKTLTIRLDVTEDDAFSGLSPVYYGNRFELERHLLQKKRLPLFIGGFQIVFAFLLLTLSSYLYMYHGHDLSLIFTSLIAFFLGAYNLAFNDLFCFLSDYEAFFNFLEYFSLYSIPFAIIAFLISSHPSLNTNLNKVLIAINALFPIVTTILHISGIIHINIFVPTLHILAIVETIIELPQIITDVIKHYHNRRNSPEYVGMTSDSILVLGLALFIVCSVIDIIKYNVLKFLLAGGEAYADINFMTIGALCFVLCLFVFYFYHGIEHINSVYMKEHLEGLAYTDSLTGLMNRAKCMQYMASVHGKFAIISIDMDNLKPVNDTLGHQEGDRILKTFADIMKQAFSGAALIGRTGGDEFLVAVENPEEGICQKMINDLRERLNAFNSHETNLNLSASCGFAYSREVQGGEAGDVFVLADNRMYEEKDKHHSSKIGRFVNDIMGNTPSKEGGVPADD
ncbi:MULTISPECIES: GGDEF domain-containing protein [unclassified Butyrivibrio]|uniref:GGDEF domain-containing protein n=1 Tax=unclassified Butyrivibrio TaxID=2639466 RepID=UPI0003B3B9F8|nr:MULTISPECIES: GGDEF domain-containing protein [unclassified Butyrivibrio]